MFPFNYRNLLSSSSKFLCKKISCKIIFMQIELNKFFLQVECIIRCIIIFVKIIFVRFLHTKIFLQWKKSELRYHSRWVSFQILYCNNGYCYKQSSSVYHWITMESGKKTVEHHHSEKCLDLGKTSIILISILCVSVCLPVCVHPTRLREWNIVSLWAFYQQEEVLLVSCINRMTSSLLKHSGERDIFLSLRFQHMTSRSCPPC